MLPKKYRLKKKDDFQRVYKKGRFFSLGVVVVNFIENNINSSRFGFVVGKNYSKSAVERNRARRVLRSSIASLLPNIISGKDFVIGVKKGAKKEDIEKITITDILEELLSKNKLLK